MKNWSWYNVTLTYFVEDPKEVREYRVKTQGKSEEDALNKAITSLNDGYTGDDEEDNEDVVYPTILTEHATLESE